IGRARRESELRGRLAYHRGRGHRSRRRSLGAPLMRRAFKFRAYPTRAQAVTLGAQVDEACRLYNAALDERRSAWRMNSISLSYYDQANQLKAIRAAGDLAVADFSACQDVLRRVDRSFAAFFRRVKAGGKLATRVFARASGTCRSPG